MNPTTFSLAEMLPAPYLDDFLSLTKPRSFRPQECFVRAGDVPGKIGFVQSGLFRYLYLDKDGNDFTKGIMTEGAFISSYSAMVSRSPSYFFIEALEPSTVLEISYEKWLILKEKDRFWDRFLINILEKGFATKERRERDLLLLDAETRYLNFLREYPEMEHRLTQKIIASYLGIQAESLSRIRKKLTS